MAPGTVTVTIARTVEPRHKAEFETWCHDMTEAVQAAPGCLGATVLWPAKPSDHYRMVFSFLDVLHIRVCNSSDVRQ